MSRGRFELDYLDLPHHRQQKKITSEIGRRWRRLYLRDAVTAVSNYLAIAMLLGVFSYAVILQISTAPKSQGSRGAANNSNTGQAPTYGRSTPASHKKP